MIHKKYLRLALVALGYLNNNQTNFIDKRVKV